MSNDDAALAKACQRGDSDAFAQLVNRHHKAVFNVAYRLLNNVEDASDVVQLTFLKALENIRSYNPRYKFYSWVYRIAINESINQINLRKRQATMPAEPVSHAAGPDQALGENEMSRRVQSCLDELSPDYRAVIVLKHFMGLSYADISDVVGVPAKTVKSRLYTARQLLKDLLESEESS